MSVRDLVTPEGVSWREYRQGLTPRYAIVWAEISLCYAALGAGMAAAALVPWPWAWLALLAAPWTGFWLHALCTFGHEAVHHNLAADKRTNDLLSEWFVWPWFGQSVEGYRRMHWQHHAHLGDLEDSEISYHHCLSPWFLLGALTGVHLVASLRRYVPGQRGSGPWPVLRSLLLHGAITVGLFAAGEVPSAAAWVAGVGFVYPFLMTVRQVLEHRRADAGCGLDFSKLAHGPVNRLFGTGLFARYLGAAGFNRHLLHHWDPSVSYTRFDDMEQFLSRTPAAAELEGARTTYAAAAKEMLRTALR